MICGVGVGVGGHGSELDFLGDSSRDKMSRSSSTSADEARSTIVHETNEKHDPMTYNDSTIQIQELDMVRDINAPLFAIERAHREDRARQILCCCRVNGAKTAGKKTDTCPHHLPASKYNDRL